MCLTLKSSRSVPVQLMLEKSQAFLFYFFMIIMACKPRTVKAVSPPTQYPSSCSLASLLDLQKRDILPAVMFSHCIAKIYGTKYAFIVAVICRWLEAPGEWTVESPISSRGTNRLITWGECFTSNAINNLNFSLITRKLIFSLDTTNI